jgi:copper chaperone CopZ
MAIQKFGGAIEGMFCEGCAQNIVNVITGVDGVRSFAVDYAKGAYSGEYDDDEVNSEHIGKEIESIGYRIGPE